MLLSFSPEGVILLLCFSQVQTWVCLRHDLYRNWNYVLLFSRPFTPLPWDYSQVTLLYSKCPHRTQWTVSPFGAIVCKAVIFIFKQKDKGRRYQKIWFINRLPNGDHTITKKFPTSSTLQYFLEKEILLAQWNHSLLDSTKGPGNVQGSLGIADMSLKSWNNYLEKQYLSLL